MWTTRVQSRGIYYFERFSNSQKNSRLIIPTFLGNHGPLRASPNASEAPQQRMQPGSPPVMLTNMHASLLHRLEIVTILMSRSCLTLPVSAIFAILPGQRKAVSRMKLQGDQRQPTAVQPASHGVLCWVGEVCTSLLPLGASLSWQQTL
jgi:hypothetical protein